MPDLQHLRRYAWDGQAFLCLLVTIFTCHIADSARAAEVRKLPGHVPRIVESLQPVGRFPGTNLLNLAITLPLRDSVGLKNHSKDEVRQPAQ
jgi:hypothetical protein